MSHFNINHSDQRDMSSLLQAYRANAVNVSPSGVINPLRTAQSQNPRVSLTSYSVSEMMQGAALYRPKGYLDDTIQQSISSDLGLLIGSEGGADQVLGARSYLLPSDVLLRQGFDDGIFSAESGMVGYGGGQSPDLNISSGSDNGSQSQRPELTGSIEDLLTWCEEHSGPLGTPIPYSREAGIAPTHENGGQTSGRYGMQVCDCTGFCTSAYFFGMGIQINNNATNEGYTGNMYNNPMLLEVEVPFEDRQPGDLMIAHDVNSNDGHGCIYYGNDQIVGTSSANNGTWITNNWMHSYYSHLKIYYFRVANLL